MAHSSDAEAAAFAFSAAAVAIDAGAAAGSGGAASAAGQAAFHNRKLMCQPSNIFVAAFVSASAPRGAVQWSVGALRMWKLSREAGCGWWGWRCRWKWMWKWGSCWLMPSKSMPAVGQLCVGIDNREITKASTN